MNLFAPLPVVGAQSSGEMERRAHPVEKSMTERSSGAAKRDALQTPAVGTGQETADVAVAHDIRLADPYPRKREDRLGIADAERQELEEEWGMERVSAGASTDGVFPITPEHRPEFEAWLAARQEGGS